MEHAAGGPIRHHGKGAAQFAIANAVTALPKNLVASQRLQRATQMCANHPNIPGEKPATPGPCTKPVNRTLQHVWRAHGR